MRYVTETRLKRQLAAFSEPLTVAGVDAYLCSTRRFWEPEFDGSDLNLAMKIQSERWDELKPFTVDALTTLF